MLTQAQTLETFHSWETGNRAEEGWRSVDMKQKEVLEDHLPFVRRMQVGGRLYHHGKAVMNIQKGTRDPDLQRCVLTQALGPPSDPIKSSLWKIKNFFIIFN